MSEIKKLKKSNQMVARVLDYLKNNVKEGMTTKDIETMAEDKLKSINEKAIPAFKGYMGYPSSICVSVNSEIVHGIPSDKKVLKEGDIVSMDFGVLYDEYYGDAAITIGIGRISQKTEKLLKVTEESLYKGIDVLKVGSTLNDMSKEVQQHVENNGFSVVRDFVGHGIGKKMHEAPQVANFVTKGSDTLIKQGLTICIEPMVNIGGSAVKILEDGWTAKTLDGSLSAHFEHAVAVTDKEVIILSKI
jgi:methionyl aminopeptidase